VQATPRKPRPARHAERRAQKGLDDELQTTVTPNPNVPGWWGAKLVTGLKQVSSKCPVLNT